MMSQLDALLESLAFYLHIQILRLHSKQNQRRINQGQVVEGFAGKPASTNTNETRFVPDPSAPSFPPCWWLGLFCCFSVRDTDPAPPPPPSGQNRMSQQQLYCRESAVKRITRTSLARSWPSSSSSWRTNQSFNQKPATIQKKLYWHWTETTVNRKNKMSK